MSEQRTPVVLFTTSYIVHGEIELVPGASLTEFVRRSEVFFAVTSARVCNRDGAELFRTDLLDVRRDAVELVVPEQLHRPSQRP